MNPSHLKNVFGHDSVFQKMEAEIIANNIILILSRTGDVWRKLTFDEYKQERLKDNNFGVFEEKYFNQVIDYCISPDTAKLFSPDWRVVVEKHQLTTPHHS